MKYSSHTGIVASFLLIVSCFLPWVQIESIHTTITGLYSGQTNYGKPGIIHIFFSLVAVAFFLLSKVWSARVNIVLCALNLAWALRNHVLISRCEMGDCPEKRAGLYFIVLFSILMLLSSLVPKVTMPTNSI